MVDEAKRRFQEIQEAYKVLSDVKRRRLYDSGLYDPDEDEEETIEDFHDFVQEMVSLMASVRKEAKRSPPAPPPIRPRTNTEEEKQYTLGELQQMLFEMEQDFNSPARPRWPSDRGSLQTSKCMADDMESATKKRTRMGFPSKDLFGGTSCN